MKKDKVEILLMGSPQQMKTPKSFVDSTGKKRFDDTQRHVKISDRSVIGSQYSDQGFIRPLVGDLKVEMVFYMGRARNCKTRKDMLNIPLYGEWG